MSLLLSRCPPRSIHRLTSEHVLQRHSVSQTACKNYCGRTVASHLYLGRKHMCQILNSSRCNVSDFTRAMPKRVLQQDTRRKLARGLTVPGASERAVHELWNVFHDEDERISRGCFTDVVEEELGPWKQVTDPIKFDTHDDTQQEIHMVNLRKYLEKLCLDSLPYREALMKAAQGTGYLTPVLYCDECTAGNVLSADKSRKSCLFYLGYLETWHLLKHEVLWIPFACVQSQCINTLQDGVSRLLCHMVEQITNAEFTAGFWPTLT